jgi:hypothetical protein
MAHCDSVWDIDDISFEIVNDMTDDPVVTVLVMTPAGRLTFTGEPMEQGDTLIVRRIHVQDASPNAIGPANLMVIAQALMEGIGYDGLVVEGAVRTTGANPGHRPRRFRFTRHIRPAPAPRARGTKADRRHVCAGPPRPDDASGEAGR